MFELSGIDPNPAVLRLDLHHYVDVVAHERFQHRDQIGDDLSRVDVHRHEDLSMGECEELASDGARPCGAGEHLVKVVATRVAFGQVCAGQLGVPVDRCQQIVEVVDNPTGELTDGLQALVLQHLRIDAALASHVADIQHRSDIDALVRRDRAPGHKAEQIAPVCPAKPKLHSLAGVG